MKASMETPVNKVTRENQARKEDLELVDSKEVPVQRESQV